MTATTFIPEGHYLTKAQIAEQQNVTPRTVQQWIDKGWLPHIQLPGLGYIVNTKDLEGFTPPKPGPKQETGPREDDTEKKRYQREKQRESRARRAEAGDEAGE